MTQQNKDNNRNEEVSPVKNNLSVWRRFFAKRWTYPAVYLGAAALIIGLMYAKTHEMVPPPNNAVTPTPGSSGSVSDSPTASKQEFIWPVGEDGAAAVVTQNYYNDSANDDSKAASLVKYEDKFYPQNGIVLGLPNDKPFTVVSATSGTVSTVDTNDPMMGAVVEVKDDNGYITRYASLASVVVKPGDKIVQGADIGKSGNNLFEASQKNHLHFEIKDPNGKYVNPTSVLPPREGSVAKVPAASTGQQASSAGAAQTAQQAGQSAQQTAPSSATGSGSGTNASSSQGVSTNASTNASSNSAANASTTDSSGSSLSMPNQ